MKKTVKCCRICKYSHEVVYGKGSSQEKFVVECWRFPPPERKGGFPQIAHPDWYGCGEFVFTRGGWERGDDEKLFEYSQKRSLWGRGHPRAALARLEKKIGSRIRTFAELSKFSRKTLLSLNGIGKRSVDSLEDWMWLEAGLYFDRTFLKRLLWGQKQT